MTLDCAKLRTCADLLHEKAAVTMEEALRKGRHRLDYVSRLHTVAKLEEAAAVVETKIKQDC